MSHHADKLVLSLFPGAGLLDRAFEEAGLCVLKGPDLLWGGDIRSFRPPAGHFWGVIGGPPCQDFSSLRRAEPTGYGREMLAEYCRVVRDTAVEWWLLENVSRVPNVEIDGYHVQRLDVDLKWFSLVGHGDSQADRDAAGESTGGLRPPLAEADCSRLRHIQFGSRSGRMLHIDRRPGIDASHGAAVANDPRTVTELIRLQGLPEDFDLPGFTVEAKKRAIGNGVPLPMGRALAAAVLAAYAGDRSVTLQRTIDGGSEPTGLCACGCGRRVTGRHKFYDFRCRKAAQRKRDRAASRHRQFA